MRRTLFRGSPWAERLRYGKILMVRDCGDWPRRRRTLDRAAVSLGSRAVSQCHAATAHHRRTTAGHHRTGQTRSFPYHRLAWGANELRHLMPPITAPQEQGIYPGFPRWIAILMTCLRDFTIRINAIPSSQRASPVSPGG